MATLLRCGLSWRRGLSAVGIATLSAAAFLSMLLRAQDRQDFFWVKADTLALFLILAAAAGLLWFIHSILLVCTRSRWARMSTHLIFILLSFLLIQLIPPKAIQTQWFTTDQLYLGILLGGALLSVMSAFQRLKKIRANLWRYLPVTGLLYPILFLQLIVAPSFLAENTLLAEDPLPSQTTGPNVIVFVFDSIAMQQCTHSDGLWRPDLPVLSALRAESLAFDQAVSCGVGTTMSLPNFLFQRSPHKYKSNRWSDRWFTVSPQTFTNGILYQAKQANYRTGLVGVYLPFQQMFNTLLDDSLVLPLTRFFAPQSFQNRLANQLIAIGAYARGPFDGRLHLGIPRLRYLPSRLGETYFHNITHHAKHHIQDYLRLIPSEGAFLFAYMAIPHSPAIYLEDGTVDSMMATYDSQLRYTDRVLGEHLAVLKERDLYNSSWILVTSDHGHHGFPLVPAEHRRVPFIIKAPHGQYSQRVNETIQLWEIAPFFKAIFQNEPPAACLRALPTAVKL